MEKCVLKGYECRMRHTWRANYQNARLKQTRRSEAVVLFVGFIYSLFLSSPFASLKVYNSLLDFISQLSQTVSSLFESAPALPDF